MRWRMALGMAGGVSWVVWGGWYVACGGWCVVLADGEWRMVGGCARTHQPLDAWCTVGFFTRGFIQSDLISSLNAAAGAVFPVAWVTPATPAMRAAAAIAMPANFRVDDDGSCGEADFPGVSGAASRSVSASWAFWYDGMVQPWAFTSVLVWWCVLYGTDVKAVPGPHRLDLLTQRRGRRSLPGVWLVSTSPCLPGVFGYDVYKSFTQLTVFSFFCKTLHIPL
jgi:hypothetical protein